MKYFSLVLLCTGCCTISLSQNMRMVAIGSSTTAGTGSWPFDSSWVNRFRHYYVTQQGVASEVHNLGVGGYNCYHGMPTSYIPPGNRPGPQPSNNVTRAVNLLAGMAIPANGVIIVNFPTNAYDTLSIAEIMNCFQTIYDSATRLGNKCYITTTQPRAGGNFNLSAVKRKLADIKDSIINRFGVANTINFYDGMYDPADSTILPAYKSGADDIHFNNTGHRILFERVQAKNVFGITLPVKLHQFTAALHDKKVMVNWTAEHDDPDGLFTIQRSHNGKDFERLQQLPVQKETGNHSYTFIDEAPLSGPSYYRLAIREREHVNYSKIATIRNTVPGLAIKNLYPIPAGKILHLEMIAAKTQPVTIDVISNVGIVLQQFKRTVTNGTGILTIPVIYLPGGVYFVRISSKDGESLIRPFNK